MVNDVDRRGHAPRWRPIQQLASTLETTVDGGPGRRRGRRAPALAGAPGPLRRARHDQRPDRRPRDRLDGCSRAGRWTRRTSTPSSRATTRRPRPPRSRAPSASTARRSTCSTSRTRRSPRRAPSATGSRPRPTCPRSPPGSTGTPTTTPPCGSCTRRSRTRAGSSTRPSRPPSEGEQQARERLPVDLRPLVVIMADVAQGGLNQAVISIEETRGEIAGALDVQRSFQEDIALPE